MTAHPALPRRSPEEQARLDASLRDVFEHKLCFNELLGFKIESLDPEAPQISFAMRKDLIGHFLHGRLHGGVIATVLDTVGGLAATVAIAEKFNDESTEQVAHRFGRIGTIDLRTDFLRQGIGKKFTATGRVTRLGGRLASVQMTLENEAGLLIATGCASYVIS
ncbi:thioesterase family protein [Quatrionicoccus australiensis]|uniref:thioesterase family protein n=1 Tax=Quatrionicoccus australiensis TaxID=138118 RepID=UPI001CF9B119|nr:thioesterase family protein [Quatrionicoccus australiensis]MCB4359701.1 thioesterase family protein [Quatrionicoccus australiensis]